jgi:protein-disulfide isomerase
MTRRLIAALALVVLALAALAACGGDDNTATTPGATAAKTKAGATAKATATANPFVAALAKLDYPADLMDGTSLGNKDAKVTIQMFEDFTCPHCLEFTAQIEPGIVDQLVKTGQARLEFHYLPLRQSSVPIMVAAQCTADENKFWDYSKRLFTEQAIADALPAAQASAALTTAFSQPKLIQYATDLGIDSATFTNCLGSDAPVQRVLDDSRLSETYGMTGTPSFAVNGKFVPTGNSLTVSGWKTLVEGAAK